MEEILKGLVPKADEPRLRRSWRAPALAVSLAAHAGLVAALWVETPPQPQAGAVVSIEIVSAAGASSVSAANSGASPSRAPSEVTKPEHAPARKAMAAPDPPRAAREPPHDALPPREAPPVPSPERVTAAPSDAIALRRPTPPDAAPAPSTSVATPSAHAPPRAVAERRVSEVALRRPTRIPPIPAKTPRLAAPPATAKRGSESGRPPAQTASVPIVAADAAPGAGPESGTTPPRYGFGSAANPIPRYPETARENGWEGVVMLSVAVGAGGEALSVSISKSSGHSLLDASAIDAVRRWRFEPARRAGVPIAGTALVPIRFRLEE